ncbi:MAG: membrane dipeptidase [Planctomycetota bacterium]
MSQIDTFVAQPRWISSLLKNSFAVILATLFASQAIAQVDKPEMKISDEAMKIHQSGMLFDGHNDLPFAVRMSGGSSFDQLDIAKPTKLHTDIPRLRSGGLKAQFWSVFVPASTDLTGNALLMTLEQIELVHEMCKRYPETFEMADTVADVRRIIKEGKIASMIGVEGGHSIENSLQVLRNLYDRGARYMTLTHSKTLAWADSATDDAKNNGLSPFGKEVIREMNRIGMLVDLSHVSEKCMMDALEITKAPVIFSHSSAKAICGHPRNVSDKVLKVVAKNGGVVMINFMSGYIVPLDKLEENKNARGDYKLVCDHIEHIIKVAGIDHVGIGSDYDGVRSLPIGLDDVSYYPNITQELLNRGYNKTDIHKILGDNVLRALEQAEDVSRKLKSGELKFTCGEVPKVETLFELSVNAGNLNRKNSLVTAIVESADELPEVVALDDGAGTAMLGQVRKTGNDKGYEVTFVLPQLDKNQTLSLTATSSLLNKHKSYEWEDKENSDLATINGMPVIEFMREPLDTSTPKRRAETYKPFHHVYVDRGRLLTKGPGGLFPHHRGIFFGFNRISYGDQTADVWHCKQGAYQSVEKQLAKVAGPVFAEDSNVIHWRGQDGQPFAEETRNVKVSRIGEATLVEFDSTIKNVVTETIKFRGDPQHAGVQIRASQDVPDMTKHLTYYIRPDGVGEPGKFRNWSNKKKESDINRNHIDLDWNAVCLGLPKSTRASEEPDQSKKNDVKLTEDDVNRYTIGYFPDAGNPSPERFSERDYARFGCYFEKDLLAGEAFHVRYCFVVLPGESSVEELTRLHDELSNPVKVNSK